MKKITGAECILNIFSKYKIKHIFGYPGGSILPFYDALLKTKKIKHILVRNEQAATHAASAYGKITGNVGVCVATSGPGATNLVTGIATAYMDSIPLIVITGQVETNLIGTDSFQEADITGITFPITKHNYLIRKSEDIPLIIEEAYKIATSGRKGPVLIDIPKNIMEEKILYKSFLSKNKYKKIDIIFKKNILKINRISNMINKSKKPLLLLGGGVISSRSESIIKKIVDNFNIPVATTLMGIGAYDETKELSIGMIGMYGSESSNKIVNNCDVLIAVGSRFSNRSIYNFNNVLHKIKIIHIDIDPAEINKNIESDISIIGNANEILESIYSKLNKVNREKWTQEIFNIKKILDIENIKQKSINPKDIISILGDLTRNSCIVTTDVGDHQMYVAKYYKFINSLLLTSGGLGTMGYGIPAAIGAAIATNSKINIIAVTGDGSFQMSISELGTIVENNLPIKIILLNNNSLGMVKNLQDKFYNSRYSEVFFTGNPNFSKLIKSYNNIKTYCVKEKINIRKNLKKVFSNKKPVFIEFSINNKK